MLTMTAGVQEVPPDNTGRHGLQTGQVTTQAASYPEGCAALDAQVLAGWRVIWLRVDRT